MALNLVQRLAFVAGLLRDSSLIFTIDGARVNAAQVADDLDQAADLLSNPPQRTSGETPEPVRD